MQHDITEVAMKALIIKAPYIHQILSGQKIWEMRSTPTKVRGPVALVQSGTGRVIGVCSIVDSIGPLSLEERLQNFAKHRVDDQIWEDSKFRAYRHAWVIQDARPIRPEVPYEHKFGAVIWTNLSVLESQRVRASI